MVVTPSRGVTAPGGVLVDRALDRSLAVHGFAKVQLISADVAASLRDEYLALRPQGGQGFDPDLNNGDVAYRLEAAALLEDRLGPTVRRLFVDHEPFLWNFICKWPHDDDTLYHHRDWMFVDERAGARSCSAWIALQDVTGHNGQLQVLPGSHLVAPELSGTDLSPEWVEDAPMVADRLVTVPVRAGEAVIFDHALVHASHGNHTDAPRVAVGCAMRPASQELVHFRGDGPGTAVRYAVDESFFIHHTPASLMAAPPDLPVAERITLGQPQSSASAAQALDATATVGARLRGRLRPLRRTSAGTR